MDIIFYDACKAGDFEGAKKFIQNHPDLDINCVRNVGVNRGYTALHMACCLGHDKIIELLLSHPRIEVNTRNIYGDTPFKCVLFTGNFKAVSLLLDDSRVDINMPDFGGRSPVWYACWVGDHTPIKWMISSGKYIDLKSRSYEWGQGDNGRKSTPVQIAKIFDNFECFHLLEDFIYDQKETRRDVRLELGLADKDAAELFATTVFLCDDHLRLKVKRYRSLDCANALRFFKIISRLPMELQMIVCRRVYGSSKDNIKSKDSECAFRALVKTF